MDKNIESKINIEFHHCQLPRIDSWESDEMDYNPFAISSLQTYYPLFELFDNYKTSLIDGSNNIVIKTPFQLYDNHKVSDHQDVNMCHKKSIFFKYGPLLDPCHFLIGKYKNLNIELPKPGQIQNKINSIHNASYVDNFCNLLVGQLLHKHSFIHGIDYYGSFLGIQKQYRFDIIDDLEYLQTYDFFHENISKLFHTSVFQHSYHNQHNSKKNKPTLAISDESCNIDFETLDNDNNESEGQPIELVYENDLLEANENKNALPDDSDNSVVSLSDDENDNDSENESNTNDENNDDLDMDSDEEQESSVEEEPLYAYLYDFPVQMICLEKCTGTFDSLLHNDELDESSGRSVLFQIIMILLCLQKAFQFTHNDLHTNNVMYTETDEEYIYYVYKSKYYKVPTFGKIFKIIDFGRAIYRFQGHIFCSDSFQEGGDGHGQYNTEPFYDLSKKRIDPNYSFDLCRLGCSIYDFVIDSEMKVKDMDGFQKIIAEWCSDDDGKNILYKKNGDERYPNFKLYKMIARLVHHHTPTKQLSHPFFQCYSISDTNAKNEIPSGALIVDIDKIPIYATSA